MTMRKKTSQHQDDKLAQNLLKFAGRSLQHLIMLVRGCCHILKLLPEMVSYVLLVTLLLKFAVWQILTNFGAYFGFAAEAMSPQFVNCMAIKLFLPSHQIFAF